MNGTLRDDENQACQNCGMIGHRKYDCPERQNFTANIICRVCGNAGHMARDCPDRQKGASWRNDGPPRTAGRIEGGDAADREYEVRIITAQNPSMTIMLTHLFSNSWPKSVPGLVVLLPALRLAQAPIITETVTRSHGNVDPRVLLPLGALATTATMIKATKAVVQLPLGVAEVETITTVEVVVAAAAAAATTTMAVAKTTTVVLLVLVQLPGIKLLQHSRPTPATLAMVAMVRLLAWVLHQVCQALQDSVHLQDFLETWAP